MALAPESGAHEAPLVVVLHMMDPPRSEAAMAAALPLRAVTAWRVYLGLPMFGSRMPAGGPDEVMRLAAEDALLNVIAPVIETAAAELPSAVQALRQQLQISEGEIGLVGGSAGGAAVLLALADSDLPVAVAALINPASQASAVVEAGSRRFGVEYAWSQPSRAAADRLDFVRRAGEIAARRPSLPLLCVVGEDDDSAFVDSTNQLDSALGEAFGSRDSLGFVTVPGLAHGLAEEPGIAPAPQSEGARQADDAVAGFLNRYLLK